MTLLVFSLRSTSEKSIWAEFSILARNGSCLLLLKELSYASAGAAALELPPGALSDLVAAVFVLLCVVVVICVVVTFVLATAACLSSLSN